MPRLSIANEIDGSLRIEDLEIVVYFVAMTAFNIFITSHT